jgi:Fe2+ or Zn2+ uptake regulation protein
MRCVEELVRKFREHGYKMTPQRRAILEAISTAAAHPTAEQIYEIVRQRMPYTSLATVYNTLRELVAIHELQELDLGSGVRRYELAEQEHAHLVCLCCGQIYDLPGDFDELRSLFRHADGFEPLHYALTVYGYCASCRASKDECEDEIAAAS